MDADRTVKFSREIARAALAKAETGSRIGRTTTQYTLDQLIEIERQVSAARECMAAAGTKLKFS
jgi:hypothetical protein